MILVYKDKKDIWHIVRELGKSGLSIVITSHCGDTEGEEIVQVPDRLLTVLCKPCREAVEKL